MLALAQPDHILRLAAPHSGEERQDHIDQEQAVTDELNHSQLALEDVSVSSPIRHSLPENQVPANDHDQLQQLPVEKQLVVRADHTFGAILPLLFLLLALIFAFDQRLFEMILLVVVQVLDQLRADIGPVPDGLPVPLELNLGLLLDLLQFHCAVRLIILVLAVAILHKRLRIGAFRAAKKSTPHSAALLPLEPAALWDLLRRLEMVSQN